MRFVIHVAPYSKEVGGMKQWPPSPMSENVCVMKCLAFALRYGMTKLYFYIYAFLTG